MSDRVSVPTYSRVSQVIDERSFDQRVVPIGITNRRATALDISSLRRNVGQCPLSLADSTDRRNRLAEHLSRRLEFEGLPRPFVV